MRVCCSALLLVLAGCLRSAPIGGSSCPCPDGYQCCLATNQCLAAGAVCQGGAVADAGAPATEAGGGPPAMADSPGPAVMRRLTLLEYQNTIRDLLGEAGGRDPTLAADEASAESGFDRGAPIGGETDARQFMLEAERLAAAAVQRMPALLPPSCVPVPVTAADQDRCAAQFISQFGLRAFRRPLTGEESGALMGTYTALRSPAVGDDFTNAVRVVLAAMLQSPYFLYHWEVGPAPIKDGALVRFDSYEIASRLSYFLWASMPDDQLFAAAAGGQLTDPQQVADQTRRMLADPKAKDVLRDFHVHWLEVADLPVLQKDLSEFPTFTPQLAQAMFDELVAASADLYGSSYLDKLFTSTRGYVDGSLAPIYGVAAPPAGMALTAVDLDPQRRAGLLTRVGFLTMGAREDGVGIVGRGLTVLERVLCRENPTPPAGVAVPPVPEPDPNSTDRQNFEKAINPCGDSCHDMYELGFAFENYDGIGAYRTQQKGMPIDATGTISLAAGPFPYQNAVELERGFANDDGVRECLVRQWMRYLLRRKETPNEARSVAATVAAFRGSDYDLRELLVALTQTRVFTHRTPSAGEVLP